MMRNLAAALVGLVLVGCGGGLGRAEVCTPDPQQQNNSGCAEHLTCSQVFAADEGAGACDEGPYQCFAICDTNADCAEQPDGATECQNTACGLSICGIPL